MLDVIMTHKRATGAKIMAGKNATAKKNQGDSKWAYKGTIVVIFESPKPLNASASQNAQEHRNAPR